MNEMDSLDIKQRGFLVAIVRFAGIVSLFIAAVGIIAGVINLAYYAWHGEEMPGHKAAILVSGLFPVYFGLIGLLLMAHFPDIRIRGEEIYIKELFGERMVLRSNIKSVVPIPNIQNGMALVVSTKLGIAPTMIASIWLREHQHPVILLSLHDEDAQSIMAWLKNS